MVSTPLKNISQLGNLPQIGVKIKNIWNHHPVINKVYWGEITDWSVHHWLPNFQRDIQVFVPTRKKYDVANARPDNVRRHFFRFPLYPPKLLGEIAIFPTKTLGSGGGYINLVRWTFYMKKCMSKPFAFLGKLRIMNNWITEKFRLKLNLCKIHSPPPSETTILEVVAIFLVAS